jgi:hypothetical protein
VVTGWLLATFDPKTSEMTRLEQKTDFRYEEGLRRATAARAVLEQPKDLMTLDGAARVWDPTGSVTADHMVVQQKSGDFTAEGHVASTRLPDKKEKPSSSMLAGDEILQARANRMTSTGDNQYVRYEGTAQSKAVAWQGANRIEAELLEIDRRQAEEPQTFLGVLADVIGRIRIVDAVLRLARPLHVLGRDLGRDVSGRVTMRPQRLSEQGLALALAVGPRRVEEIAAERQGALECL